MAGFIGFHLARKLIEKGDDIIGLDNINDYYDTRLKYGRLRELGIPEKSIRYNEITSSEKYSNCALVKLDLSEKEHIDAFFEKNSFDAVCHLGAQAGVRYSIQNPYIYLNSNLTGFLNILENCRRHEIKNLTYASSSSVYGLNRSLPLSEHGIVEHPINFYAATKKSNELMAHTYSYLYDIPATGLRFFTSYGPWGRPDMALFIFTKAILNRTPIDVYNNGDMHRDFTYVDDIVRAVEKIIEYPAEPSKDWDPVAPDPSISCAPYRIYNVGNGRPVKLIEFIEAIEKELGIKAIKNMMPLQPGDIHSTHSDSGTIEYEFGIVPKISVEEGIKRFIAWYKQFYHIE